MKSIPYSVFALLVVFFVADLAFAATTTSDFRDFKNPFLVTYRSGQILDSYTTKLGPVKIIFNVGNLSFSGGSYVTGTPSDPANVSGWGAVNQTLPLIFNMDMPIGGFGITFDNIGNTAGSILAVYDGPNGTGQLIGQIESIPVPPPWSATNQPIDFVGVIDENNQIRSAVLTAHGSDAIRIRAMAITVPEMLKPWPHLLYGVICCFTFRSSVCRR